MSSLLSYLRRMLGAPGDGATADAQLLARFVERHDEAAFEALVRRYGAMVFGVCRRLLACPQDVEDAFQVTFLVLARKAGSIGRRELVGHWLYAVASRVARKARAHRARQRAREQEASASPAAEPAYEMGEPGVNTLFDEEIARLPGKYRLPVVLCYLEGLTKAEAAQRLGWPEGTVSTRLARAREMLRERLSRRGWTLPAGLPVPAEAVPEALVVSTTQSAGLFAAGTAAAEALIPAGARVLAKGVMRSMAIERMRAAVVPLVVAVLVGLGGAAYYALASRPNHPGAQAPEATLQPPPPKAAAPIKLYVAGAGAPRPGVYTFQGPPTYRDVLRAASIDLGQVRGKGQVAYLITLSLQRAGVAVSGELTGMLNKANETMTAAEVKDAKAPPRLTLWVGTAQDWNHLQSATRRSAVVAGANAEQRAAELRKQGVPVKVVTSTEQGQWPPQYDELMVLAEKAGRLKAWPGGESWLADAQDTARIRKLVKDCIEAAVKGDAPGAARLYPGKSPDGLRSLMTMLKRMVDDGAAPADLRFLAVGRDHALAVSDFFPFQEKQSRPRKMICLTYAVQRQKGNWVLRDIDLADVERLINEVRRFDRKERRPGP